MQDAESFERWRVMVRTLLITCGGLGFMRPAPGTWGSMPPAAVAFVLLAVGVSPWVLNTVLGVILVVSCAVCVGLGSWAEKRFGRKDASQIVVDETAGQCISLMFWPAAFMERTTGLAPMGSIDWRALMYAAGSVGGAFVLFRIFDIIKPPPAYALQKLRAGWGVLVDDLFAGLYAAIVVQVVLRMM